MTSFKLLAMDNKLSLVIKFDVHAINISSINRRNIYIYIYISKDADRLTPSETTLESPFRKVHP